MTAIIIIGVIIFIIYAATSKEKHTNTPSYKKSNVSNTTNQLNRTDTKLIQENMTANLKIVDNIRIKCRSLAEIIGMTYESKVCPKCNERKMIFLNVEPTGQFITCECSNCNRFQTLKLNAGKNGSEALQVYDEIEYLEKSVIRPVTEDFWDIDVDFSFMVNAETDSISSKNNVTDNLDSRMKSDSTIEKVNIKDEPTVSIKENPQRIALCNFEGKVPYWENRNIYSHTEINDADISQIIFYNLFKTRFLNDDYIDLQGNVNYAFILYFDLKVDYIKHRDVELLEKQLLTLAECYPNTKRIVFNTLANECVLKGELKRAEKMQAGLINENDNSIIDITPLSYKINSTNNLQKSGNYGLSTWFRSEFSNEERNHILKIGSIMGLGGNILINDKIQKSSSFVVKFLKNLAGCFNNKDDRYLAIKILDKAAELVSDKSFILDIHFLYSEMIQINYSNRLVDPKSFQKSIWACEQQIKIAPQTSIAFRKEWTNSILPRPLGYYQLAIIREKEKHYQEVIDLCNEALTAGWMGDWQLRIERCSKKLKYDFDVIVSEQNKKNDLEKDLKSVPKIHEVKRKKIQLDRASINDAQQQHAGTVELLNEYLKDDFEDETNSTNSPEINNEEINIALTQKNEEIHPSSFVSELALTLIHTTALELFAKSNFSVAQSEFEAFAKSKGILKNQLIESINDTCYEFLDDILIEEEVDYYTIDPKYYQRLLLK